MTADGVSADGVCADGVSADGDGAPAGGSGGRGEMVAPEADARSGERSGASGEPLGLSGRLADAMPGRLPGCRPTSSGCCCERNRWACVPALTSAAAKRSDASDCDDESGLAAAGASAAGSSAAAAEAVPQLPQLFDVCSDLATRDGRAAMLPSTRAAVGKARTGSSRPAAKSLTGRCAPRLLAVRGRAAGAGPAPDRFGSSTAHSPSRGTVG